MALNMNSLLLMEAAVVTAVTFVSLYCFTGTNSPVLIQFQELPDINCLIFGLQITKDLPGQ